LKQALQQLKDAESAWQVSNTQMKIADEELRLAQRRFSVGSSSGLEISNAQTSVSTAAESNLEATFIYEASKLNLYNLRERSINT